MYNWGMFYMYTILFKFLFGNAETHTPVPACSSPSHPTSCLTSHHLQVLLSQLELWLHSAACLPNHFLPTSRLVCVSCSTVKEFILAALEQAHSALIARMHCSAQAQCRELSAKVDRFCKVRERERVLCAGVCCSNRFLHMYVYWYIVFGW